MALARTYLWICLVLSLVFGGAYLVAAGPIAAASGIEPVSAAGWTDLRANYAGYQLGMALLLGWCLRDTARYEAGLLAFAAIVGALALCRLVGLGVEGFAPQMAAATAIESAMALFALFARARLGAMRS